jgi:hypothetical protein
MYDSRKIGRWFTKMFDEGHCQLQAAHHSIYTSTYKIPLLRESCRIYTLPSYYRELFACGMPGVPHHGC